MPLTIPTIDDRRYQDLLDETLARIPVHNPEWTNFNESDPGITLIELFAFLTENLLYRANQIPERNRRKFLSLLGVPLQPASPATGLVTFANDRGPRQTITLTTGLEVRAGQVPFRTTQGLDVLPVEAQVYYKRKLDDPELVGHYRQLYATLLEPPTGDVSLYETVPLWSPGSRGIDLGSETVVDSSLWIAVLLRAADRPYDDAVKELVRAAIGGRILNLGVAPWLGEAVAPERLAPGGRAPEDQPLLQYEMPKLPASGGLGANRRPDYQRLPATSTRDITDQPGVVQITLPPASQLRLWNNLEPLDAGTGDFPPALEDTTLADRLITWIRVRAPAGVHAHLWWAGINTVPISQQAIIAAEPLPDGTGEPDQVVVLARSPVVPGSVRLMVTTNADPDDWKEIEDLYAAGPEVSVPDPRSPPSSRPRQDRPVNAFRLDPEAGRLYFGDGTRGRRPAAGATLRADYAYSQGGAGNVAAGAINASPALPAGLKVSNPVATWGGTDKETVAEGEKQITRYLQHRDRLVTAVDFETITWRTPGVELGRVEVLPAYSPELPASAPGDAAGAVTVMVIPRSDPVTPRAPRPDRLFLDAIGNYLETRRLVTTEVFLCGPVYKPIWISASVQVLSGLSIAEVCLAVEKALLDFLSPMPVPPAGVPEPAAAGETAGRERGWPLRTPVVDRELWAVASRVPGVQFVRDVFIAESALPQAPVISLSGLELVEVAGISVVGNGDPISLDALRGQPQPAPADEEGARFVPVPVLLEECR